ncbi:hypothetical protein R1sor_021548 [Riccia sorocarpa]|uniref:Major facilitator superfamily (MFS) profile domain-containing protein n=1 Tax=Riccia sorocarpa TaxID=122646 RepID=A0ABD3GKB8_9MARC
MESIDMRETLLGVTGENGHRTEHGVVSAAADSRKELLTVDDMLVKYVGEFGPAQFWHFFLVSLAWTVESFQTMVMIFGERVPEWRCVEQGVQVKDIHNTSTDDSRGFCHPSVSSVCNLDPGSWEWVGGKSASVVSQFNLICGEEYKVGLVGSLFFIGSLIGAGVWGSASDSRLGRKGSQALCCLSTVIMGVLTSQAPSYWFYVLGRFSTGLTISGIGLSAFVLSTEIVGPNRRGKVGMSAFYFFSTGIILLPLFDIAANSWRELYLFTALPGALYCILVLPTVWESPRWYLVKGRTKDAMRVMRAFARRNGNVVPETVGLLLHDHPADSEEEDLEDPPPLSVPPKESSDRDGGRSVAPSAGMVRKDSSQTVSLSKVEDSKEGLEFSGTLVDVFRYSETRVRMILMVCIWLILGVCYYGISLNVVNLGFNLRLSVFFNGLVEIPAFVLTTLFMGRLGRRSLLTAAMSMTGVCSFVGSFLFHQKLPNDLSSESDGFHFLMGGDSGYSGLIRLLCGVIGIFGAAGAYNLVYIYTTELFPTVVRNSALGLATQAASIGSIIAPVVVVLGRTNAPLPFIIFGCLSMLGGALAIRLPETKDESLHETMEGMERVESLKNDAAAVTH